PYGQGFQGRPIGMPTPRQFRTQPVGPQPTIVVQQTPMQPAQPVAQMQAQMAQAAPFATGKPPSVLEYVMKHPVAPVAGAVLFMISQLTDEPVPPTIPV